MADIVLQGLTKVYNNGVHALVDLNLAINDGESCVFVGPSGCGKTTTLRLIAGLEQPSSGTIHLAGRPMNGIPPRRRDVAMLFQKPCLLPGQTVRANLDWGNRLRRGYFARPTLSERQALIRMAQFLGLDGILDRRAGELSGGQMQRVALGRALLRDASVRLLDEPLGHLDLPLRRELRRELHLLRRKIPTTMVYVTHDPEEALALGDRIAVLEGGVLRQQDTPGQLLSRPRHRFVAEFFSSRPMNVLAGTIAAHESGFAFVTAAGKQPLKQPLPAERNALWRQNQARPVFLGVRSEDTCIQWNEAPSLSWEMVVVLVECCDRGSLVTCAQGDVRVIAFLDRPPSKELAVNDRVRIGFELHGAFLFDRASGLNLEADG